MDTIAARKALNTIWRLVREANERPLQEMELNDVRNACAVLDGGVPEHEFYSTVCDNLCVSIFSSGLFDARGGVGKLNGLLREIDAVRRMLD